MTDVELRYERESRLTLVKQGGVCVPSHQCRIFGKLRIFPPAGTEVIIRECLIDTGAPFSVFPSNLYSLLNDLGCITALCLSPFSVDVTAFGVPAEFGLVDVALIDRRNRKQSKRTTIVAKFALEPVTGLAEDVVIFGLNGNSLDQRTLMVHGPDLCNAAVRESNS